MLESLNARGVAVLRGAKIEAVREGEGTALVDLTMGGEARTLEAEAVLVATAAARSWRACTRRPPGWS